MPDDARDLTAPDKNRRERHAKRRNPGMDRMDVKRLVGMANQIGEFFEAEPDHAAALEGVANHIQRFWEPRMRRALLQWLDQQGGEGLRPLVLEALRSHRARLQPKEQSPA